MKIALTIVAFVLTAAAAAAQDRPVLNGLEAAMTQAASALRDGERLRATDALDRALHLGEFATSASPAPHPDGVSPYRDALEAVKQARHALQNGRPDEAAGRLRTGAADLAGHLVLAPEFTGLDAERFGEYEGRPVLNAFGVHLGVLRGFTRNDQGWDAVVAHGGYLRIGETETAVPAGSLLAGKHFIVLPSEVVFE